MLSWLPRVASFSLFLAVFSPKVLFANNCACCVLGPARRCSFALHGLSPRTAVKQVLLSFWQTAARQDCQLWGRY